MFDETKEMSFEEFADKWGPLLGTKEALWLSDYWLQGIWDRLWSIFMDGRFPL